ncbi:MAG: hypothetical protein MR763_02315 [Clostridiales bacterium]|nr:hypothetical protein [Clostridiales bacterium]
MYRQAPEKTGIVTVFGCNRYLVPWGRGIATTSVRTGLAMTALLNKHQLIARIPLVFFHNYKLLPTFCQCQTPGGGEIFQGKGGFAPLPYCFFPGEKL